MSPIAKFRDRLTSKRVQIGAAITLSDPLVSDALASRVDFLWIDLEHTAMNPQSMVTHLISARGRDKPSLVRVMQGTEAFIKPILDAGADGIIVPRVRSEDEVLQAVNACRYPPTGNRGFGPQRPTDYGRKAGPDYMRKANQEVFLGIQIETYEAFDRLDLIAAIPGIDALVIGPYDLSIALGVPGELRHPKLIDAIKRVVQASRNAGLSVGAGMGPDTDYATLLGDLGVQWLQVGGDLSYIVQKAESVLSQTAVEQSPIH